MQNKYPHASMVNKHKLNYDENDAQVVGFANGMEKDERDIACMKCQEYHHLMEDYQRKIESFVHKQQKLKGIFKKLEQQNGQVMRDADLAVQDFQHIIRQLQQEVYERDQIIIQQNTQIEELKMQIDQQAQFFQEKTAKFQQQISDLKNQYKKNNNFIVRQSKQGVTNNNNEVAELKSQILKMISQKLLNQRKNKQQFKKMQIEMTKLSQQIKSLQIQITNKENLIKYLSQSNNEIRIELIELKGKLQVEDATWITEKRKSFLHQISDQFKTRELKRQNEQLRQITENLQSEMHNLMLETEEIQHMLVKVKMERDMFQRAANKLRKSNSADFQLKRGFGQIRHQYNTAYSEQNNRNNSRLSGGIRINTDQSSLRTSIAGQIQQQQLQNSFN